MVLKVDGHAKSGWLVQKSAFLSRNGRSSASRKIMDGQRSQSGRSRVKVDGPSGFNWNFEMTESGRPQSGPFTFLPVKSSTLSHLTINFDR